MTVALAWERAAKMGREKSLTEVQARKVLNDILENTGQERMNLVTAEVFLREWAASKELANSNGTAKRYKNTVQTFLDHLGSKAKSNLASITPREVETFRNLQLSEGKSAGTANMVVKTLRIPFNAARRQGIIMTNPAEAVQMMVGESGTKETFTQEQLGALLAHKDVEWRGLILLGATAGIRLGDASRMTWANVDFERKVIRFVPQKTARATGKRKPLEVIMLPDLENYLLALPVKSRKVDAPLFPKLSQRRLSGAGGLSLQFKRVMESVGIAAAPVEDKKAGKGRRFSPLSFHSLRHTYVSIMGNLGVARELRMKLAGHTSDVHDRYSHIELETLRNALEQFPSLTQAKH
jgi:integrase